MQIRQTKLRVAQAVAEGIERREGRINVSRTVFGVGVRRVGRAACVLVIVVERLLPDGAREGDGQLAARIHIAEENIGDAVACLRSGEPRFENRVRIFREPFDCQRTPVHQNDDDGLARRFESLHQIQLSPRQIERRARRRLAAHVR